MYDPEQITFFAKTDARGQQVPFGIKAIDRTKHVYVIGKTGMGKSTLLENMAVQDIKNGNGLAFIDPHGQTAETLLDYIPEERKDDVVYFAPFDTDNPVSFNVMEDVGEDKRHLVVSGLMSVFKKIWVDAWSARMEYILSNTLLALLEYPDSTLLGVNRMLSDKEYRKRVIENITDPAVKSFWVDEFLKYNERYMQEAGDAIKNKIGQFTSNPLIRNIIGQSHSSFDIREIMDDRKILIMNLSKGLVGEQNANLLGSMLTTRIYLAAMSRADKTAQEMKEAPNFYFYVDEFQSFANATFADILSEARKYKLNLTIAHQYIEQMEEEVRNAVFGNVGTIISFRVGPFDAEVLETVYTPKFLAPDIVNLGFAQIYLTLMIDGIGSQPFSAVTLPPIEISGVSCKDMVIARSREQYSKKRIGVEETIHAWHAKNFSDKPPYVPKHLREEADGGTLPNTGANKQENSGRNGTTPNASYKGSTNGNNSSAEKTYNKASSLDPVSHRSTTQRNDSGTQSKRVRNNADNGRSQNNKQVNNSDRSRDTRGVQNKPMRRDPVNNRDVESTQKKEKNLADLRSVLKDISGNSPQEKEKNFQNDFKEKKDESLLKDVLAAALGTQGAVETHRKVSENTRQKNNKNGNTFIARIEKGDEADMLRSEESQQTQEIKKNESRNRSKINHEYKANEHKRHEEAHSQKDIEKKESEIKQIHTHTQVQTKVADTPSTADAQMYGQMKNIDDPLSPKKLERMMRVTTSDKPPIK